MLVERWREMLQPIRIKGLHYFLAVFSKTLHLLVFVACTTALSSSDQLKGFKSLASFLQQQCDDDCVTVLLKFCVQCIHIVYPVTLCKEQLEGM